MNDIDLDFLENLASSASDGPWYVRYLDDELRMGSVVVSNQPDSGKSESLRSGDWPGDAVVAVCLLQYPPCAVIEDNRFKENAKFIAEMRNSIGELIRLARLGIEKGE